MKINKVDLQLAKIPIPEKMTGEDRFCTTCYSILNGGAKKTITVDYGKVHEITYDPQYVMVSQVEQDEKDGGLIFTLEHTSKVLSSSTYDTTPSEFMFELTIPRQLLDTRNDGKDSDFFIAVDKDVITYSQKYSINKNRTLLIPLKKEFKTIKIVRTPKKSSSRPNIK